MPNARSFFHCLICVGRILKSHTPAGWIEPTPHSGFKFDRFRFGLTCGSSEKLFVLFLAVLHADIHLFAISAVLTLFNRAIKKSPFGALYKAHPKRV